jgi:hypothetical protein
MDVTMLRSLFLKGVKVKGPVVVKVKGPVVVKVKGPVVVKVKGPVVVKVKGPVVKKSLSLDCRQKLHFLEQFRNFTVNRVLSDKLWGTFRSHRFRCMGCSTRVCGEDWVLQHLCDKSCCAIPHPFVPHENTHVCSRSCGVTIKCVYNTRNMSIVCKPCHKKQYVRHYTTVQHFPQWASLPTESKSPHCKDLLTLRKKLWVALCRKRYLMSVLQCFQIEEDILGKMWDKLQFQQEYKCGFLCGNRLSKSLFVRFSGKNVSQLNTILQDVRIVCRTCKKYERCSSCQDLTVLSDGIVQYQHKTVRGKKVCLNTYYCTRCFGKSRLLNTSLPSIKTFQTSKSTLDYQKQQKPKLGIYKQVQRDVSILFNSDCQRFPNIKNLQPLETLSVCSMLYHQKNLCFLCEQPVTCPKTRHCVKVNTDFSINRIDNNYPHTLENIMITCLRCNMQYRTCTYCKGYSIEQTLFLVAQQKTICHQCFNNKM